MVESHLGVGLVAKAFTDANPNYEVTMLPGNSTSNVIQLQQKKADLSIGMHTMNMAAIKGTAPYKKAFPNIAAYANLCKNIICFKLAININLYFS